MIRFAVLTLSDSGAEGKREDLSGSLAVRMLTEELDGVCVYTAILPDKRDLIASTLRGLADEEGCDLIVTTGGTGLSPRDVTPEATLAVIDREIPGMAEAMRAEGMKKTPYAMLSRGRCGARGNCLILNCSGSPKAVKEQLGAVLTVLNHAMETLRGDAGNCAETVHAKEELK
jgi:molybdopterin adenylyltransferase